MKPPVVPPPRGTRGRDLCHLAFRQTLDLLTVADEALEELCRECPDLPDLDGLLLRALNEMALGERELGTRAPTHVALVHSAGDDLVATLYALGPEGYRSTAGPFRFAPQDFPAVSRGAEAVVVSNAGDEGGSPEDYQSLFHPAVRRAVGAPVTNFVAYRVAGDRPGAVVALNYPGSATRYEAQVLAALAVTLGAVWTLASRISQVEEAFLYLIGALARASEVNDEVTGYHILRVGRHAEALALAAGYGADDARVISYSAQLHDVGKIHTPRDLLRKRAPLTPEERALVREHTLQGEKIIGGSPKLAVARRIAAAHHENWDGSGYPLGLAGEAIPREARLVKIVDVYEALRSERPYKEAYSHERACEVLLSGDARIDPLRHFDPELLDVFRRSHSEFQRIHAELQPWP